MTSGNTVTLLQNGDDIFPAMLEAIASARQRIDFCTYVYWKSAIANRFAQALAERARAGVTVRLIIDAIGGATMDTRTLTRLERAGVQVAWFRPLTFKHLLKANHRTHRKILVVDGVVGFTGGVGIAEEWTGRAHSPHHWRETHCRLTGPVCTELLAAFADNWRTATGQRLAVPQAFGLSPVPADGRHQSVSIMATASRGGEQPAVLEHAFLAAFDKSRHNINLTTAYFVPNHKITNALIAAAQRGVKVRIITNGPRTNHRFTRQCSRSLYAPLLEAGVSIYEYSPTVLHSKTLTIDGHWCHIGSANMDDRSLLLNDEFDISFEHRALSKGLDEAFAQDLAHSREIDAGTWHERPWLDKTFEKTAWLLRTQV
jgi:cardiolipin synthase